MKQKISAIIIVSMMMTMGVTLITSDNASAAFVENLAVPWDSQFIPRDSAWDANGSNCIVVGNDTSGLQSSVWCYNDTAGSWSPVFEGTDPDLTPAHIVMNSNTSSYYGSIQGAINNATPGNILRVWAGTYYGSIYINKTLTLTGNGSANTIINGNGTGNVVTIQANGVILKGFTITGGGSLYAGVHLYKVDNCVVENNSVKGNNDGILVDGASNNMIRDNYIQNNAGVGVRTKESEETKTVVGLTDNGGAVGYGLMFGMDTSDPQYEVMYDFEPNCQDGRWPTYCSKLIQDQIQPNYFFGTTPSGGKYNKGAIFRIDSTGTDYSILYEFRGYPADGNGPTGELFQFGDVLYGTTTNGGPMDYGTMFRINRDGTGYALLHSFTGGTNGYRPSNGGLAWDGSYFYGTTMYGGTNGYGCIYRINMDGTGYTYLFSFLSANGYYPYGTLAFDAAYLYGVARQGGVNYGTVYRILKDGSGFNVLHTFAAAVDGRNPCAGLLLQGSVLYGTTYSGATGMTGGTAFRINNDGTLYSILHSFTGTPDGSNTYGGLTMVGGMLYGMSYRGGLNNYGSIYKLSTDGLVYYRIYNFTLAPAANGPYGSLTYDGTMLYGMTYYGGAFNQGAMFRVMPDGSGFQQLHDFNGTFYNGIIPAGQVAQAGNYLFGIASQGGIYDSGTVFRTNLDGTGYTTLYPLQYSVEGGGFYYTDGLTIVGTRLYGLSYEGGANDYGAIFSLDTDGTNPAVIYTFTGSPDGAYGVGSLVWDGSSYLYGMTEQGGASSWGTIFRVEIATNNVDYLYSFTGTPDPEYPRGSLLDDGEFLYGVSSSGGTNDRGTVFKMEKATSILTVIHNFTVAPDLYYPSGTLVEDGTYLYGIAGSGGADSNGGIYRLRKDGSDYGIMHSFVYSESGYGSGHLVIDGSMLYGMANEGALYGYGTAFRMNKDTFIFSTLHSFQNEEHYYTNLAVVTNYATSSSNNIIYHNNFIGNTVQALNDDPPINMWNDVYPVGGNYWSDYTGPDDIPAGGGDGIIDAPLIIPSGAMDSYPWLRQNGWKMPYSTFNSVAWDSVNARFWLCGDVSADAQSTFYYVPASAPTTMVPVMAPAINFTALAADNTGNLMIGGNDLQYIFYYDSNIGNGYGLVENSTGAMYGWNITGITFNPFDNRFYCVGNVKNMDTGVAFFTDPLPLNSSGHKCYIDNSDFMNFPGIGGLRSISWNPLRNYAIAVGDGVYRLSQWNGLPDHKLTWSTVKSPEAGKAYYDISWDTDGWNEAGIVGVNQTYGNYWRFYHTNPQLLQGNASAVAGTVYRTCAMKPPSSPKWLLIPYSSGGWRINIEEKYEGAQVAAEAAGPSIFAMDFRSQGTEISKLDQQIDVDHTYTFYIDANNTAGMVDRWSFSTIELWAWFDEGFSGSNSNASSISPTPPVQNRTRQFALIYNVTTKVTTFLYPTGYPEEFAWQSTWEDMTVYADNRRHVMFNITFKAQTRAANGSGFSPPLGGNIWDRNSALNDINSWDFNITLTDYTNKSVRNTTYGEFGVKKAVSIISSGNPTGAAAPGAATFLLSNPTLITYSANTPYFVNVSLKTHLLRGGVGPEIIGVSNISVRNEDTQSAPSNSDIPYSGAASPFTAPGEANAKRIWGGGSPMSPPNHGTVAVGPSNSDYNLIPPGSAFTLVNWWATIPAGTLQGTYWATITFTVTYF
jgi:parallel beta-helix repeat protein/uncharacterized repeat protein (TIGR03803 family)